MMFYLFGAIVFAVEFVAWCAIAGLPLQLLGRSVVGWICAVLVFAAVIAFWGAFMAPKARNRFRTVPYYLTKAAIYGVAGYSLYRVNATWTVAFAAATIASESYMYLHDSAS